MSKRAEKLTARLTLEEKISLLAGADFWHTASVKGVRATTLSDGPHGLRKQENGADNLGINSAVKATCFPNAVNIASSFDTELARELGETLGRECRALGVDVLLGPGVNIKRCPLCGRNFEYFSEDPYLSGAMAASLINGVQSKGAGVSVKHFACNNQEYRRNLVSVTVDERTLREIYLAAFEYAVKNANPRTIMCAYNKVNGVYCSENEYLLNDILRREWGFKGAVVSDWGAVVNRRNTLKAGLDLEMPPNPSYSGELIDASLKDGSLDIGDIDRSAERIVDAALAAEEAACDGRNYEYDRAKDHELARKAAVESMVLLKNDGMLPLVKGKRIVFVGEFAAKPRYQGGGSSHVNTDTATAPIDIARERYGAEYVKGYDIEVKADAGDDLVVEAIEKVGKADAAVLFMGLPERLESEGYDRKRLELPHNQIALLRELRKVQENIAVVLFNGAPVTMPWLEEARAVLEAYLPGEAVGEAVTDLLYGECSPCGKLAETFPIALEDNPSHSYFPGGRLSVEYREGIYVGYRYYDKAGKHVLFPFGHGLSYAAFEYSDFKLNRTKIGANDSVTATVTVKNVGGCTAKEIVQIYVEPPQDTDVFMPLRALAAFKKIELNPGMSATLDIDIPNRAFEYYNVREGRYITLGGAYKLTAAASSRDIRAEAALEVTGESVSSPYDKNKLKSYFSGEVSNVPDEEFRELYGKELPPKEFAAKRKLTIYDSLNDARDTFWGRLVMKLIVMKSGGSSDASMGESDIYLESIGNTPLAVIPALSGNVVDIDSMYDLVNLFNGKRTLSSAFRLLKAAVKIMRALK